MKIAPPFATEKEIMTALTSIAKIVLGIF